MPLLWIAAGLSMIPLAAVVGYRAGRPDGMYADGLHVTVRPQQTGPDGMELAAMLAGAFVAWKFLGRK